MDVAEGGHEGCSIFLSV
uniref:Uncharacterized protein n=1 Tax=Moniliophthora roreri TaxID=221103 RepID=A0A0W0FYT1_MONRR